MLFRSHQEFGVCVFDVTLDCEDGAPVGGEHEHAHLVAELVQAADANARVAVRVHPVDHPCFHADVQTIVGRAASRLCHVMLPKVESSYDVDLVARHLRGAGGAGGVGAEIGLVALIESALGLEHASNIARASPRLRSLAFGGVDLSADLGGSPDWEPMLAHRAHVVRCAAAAGLGVLDVPYLAIDDAPGLKAECERVRAMGFSGKLAIHPNQVSVIADAFMPTAAEIEFAKGVLAAAEAAGGGACTYRGKMVDEPVLRSARRDRKSTRLNSSHSQQSRMPSSA